MARLLVFVVLATIATVVQGVAVWPPSEPARLRQSLLPSYPAEPALQKPISDTASALTQEQQQQQQQQRTQGRWRTYPQDDRTCAANTTKHFTGHVPVTDDKELFFWFAESRSDPLADPTILWLNGGPAGSSMPGFFQEVGPCVLVVANNDDNQTNNSNKMENNNNMTTTVVNPDSWVNFANLLVLDQPAGTGFSTAAGDSAPVTLAESTLDFSTFLAEFAGRFPEYFGHGFYVAGESFGGRYVPRYVSDIVSKQKQQQQSRQQQQQQLRGKKEEDDALVPDITIDGIILVDAFIDGISPFIGHYELFCTDEYQDILRFNATACESIGRAVPRAAYLLGVCQETQDQMDCETASRYVLANIYIFLEEEEAKGGYTRYDLREPCELKDMACIPPMQFYSERHLNRPDIQKLLGFESHREYRSINFSLNEIWSRQPEITIPTTRNVSWLLDEGDLRILVFNGVYDAAVTTPGMFREFDQLPWSQHEVFRNQPKINWYWATDRDGNGSLIKGGEIKGVPKLQVASVYDAGHMSPGDAKPAVASLVRRWIDKSLMAAVPT